MRFRMKDEKIYEEEVELWLEPTGDAMSVRLIGLNKKTGVQQTLMVFQETGEFRRVPLDKSFTGVAKTHNGDIKEGIE